MPVSSPPKFWSACAVTRHVFDEIARDSVIRSPPFETKVVRW